MRYLTLLNNETITFLTVLLFLSLVLLTITTICEFLDKHKLKFDLFVVCRILNIALLIIWQYVLFSLSKHTDIGEIIVEILAYYSALILAFEIPLMFFYKKWLLGIDFAFLIMLLPFWKYASEMLSIIFIVIAIVYLFMKSVVLIYNSLFNLKNNLNYYSIKEALDKAKNGLLFEDKFNVVYENLAMKTLLEKLQISKRLSALEIWEKLKNEKSAKLIDENQILIFIDSQVFAFSIIKGIKLQIVAFDISKEYKTMQKIEKTQTELQSKYNEILQMVGNLEEIERQKEILALKSKLHDILGQRLFIIHYILNSINNQNFDIEHIKQVLSTMLLEIENDETTEIQNMQNSIISSFNMIGFEIKFSGDLPKDTKKAKAIINIIRECATNAIRHSNATKLFVNISKSKIEITDNGKTSSKTFEEGTGIKGMRITAENIGATFIINNNDRFKIILRYS